MTTRLMSALDAWQKFYGNIQTYSGGERGMVQLDNGSAEYAARVEVMAAAREALAQPSLSLADQREDAWAVRELTRLQEQDR